MAEEITVVIHVKGKGIVRFGERYVCKDLGFETLVPRDTLNKGN